MRIRVRVLMLHVLTYNPWMPACKQPDLGADTWRIRFGCPPDNIWVNADELPRALTELIFKQCQQLEHALISIPDAVPFHWGNRGLQAFGGAPGRGSYPWP